MHWIYLIHEFHNLSWITEINELFHDILIYWDAPVCMCICIYILNIDDIILCFLSVRFLHDPSQDCPEYIMEHSYTVGCRIPLKYHDLKFKQFSINVSIERNHTVSKEFHSLQRKGKKTNRFTTFQWSFEECLWIYTTVKKTGISKLLLFVCFCLLLLSNSKNICYIRTITIIIIHILISNKCCSCELSIYQRILTKLITTKILSCTTVINIYNNNACFLSSKSAY